MRAEKPLRHYCIVRSDLSLGDLAAQLVHAAGESSPGDLPSGTYAICLGVENELELLKFEAKMHEFGVPHVAIREPDEPFCGALMAIGVVPMVPTKQLRKVTKGLRLLK